MARLTVTGPRPAFIHDTLNLSSEKDSVMSHIDIKWYVIYTNNAGTPIEASPFWINIPSKSGLSGWDLYLSNDQMAYPYRKFKVEYIYEDGTIESAESIVVLINKVYLAGSLQIEIMETGEVSNPANQTIKTVNFVYGEYEKATFNMNYIPGGHYDPPTGDEVKKTAPRYLIDNVNAPLTENDYYLNVKTELPLDFVGTKTIYASCYPRMEGYFDGGSLGNYIKVNVQHITSVSSYVDIVNTVDIAPEVMWTASGQELTAEYTVTSKNPDYIVRTANVNVIINGVGRPAKELGKIYCYDAISKPPYIGPVTYQAKFDCWLESAKTGNRITSTTTLVTPVRTFNSVISNINMIEDAGLRLMPNNQSLGNGVNFSIDSEFYDQYRDDYPSDMFTAGTFEWYLSGGLEEGRTTKTYTGTTPEVGNLPGIFTSKYIYKNPTLFTVDQVLISSNNAIVNVVLDPITETTFDISNTNISTEYGNVSSVSALLTTTVPDYTAVYTWYRTEGDAGLKSFTPMMSRTNTSTFTLDTSKVGKYQVYCHVKLSAPGYDDAEFETPIALVTVNKQSNISGVTTNLIFDNKNYYLGETFKASTTFTHPDPSAKMGTLWSFNGVPDSFLYNQFIGKITTVGPQLLSANIIITSDNYVDYIIERNATFNCINRDIDVDAHIKTRHEILVNSVANPICFVNLSYPANVEYSWYVNDELLVGENTNQIVLNLESLGQVNLKCNISISGDGIETKTVSALDTINVVEKLYTNIKYVHPLPWRKNVYFWLGWWVLDIIEDCKKNNTDWRELIGESEYSLDLNTVLYILETYPDVSVQESRNGYILDRKFF